MADYKNPEWYVEQFKTHNIIPKRGSAQVENGKTCAVGIAAVALGIDINEAMCKGVSFEYELAQKMDLPPGFLHGIEMGFDGFDVDAATVQTLREQGLTITLDGYALGNKIWHKLWEEEGVWTRE